jgi:fatty-acid desaturase
VSTPAQNNLSSSTQPATWSAHWSSLRKALSPTPRRIQLMCTLAVSVHLVHLGVSGFNSLPQALAELGQPAQLAGSILGSEVGRDILLILVGYWLIFGWGVAIGLHRGISHRRLSSQSIGMWICTYLGTLSALGRPMDWAIVHRVHHQFSDLPDDPHSPRHSGFWRVLTNTWTLSPSQQRHLAKPSLARDLVASRPIQFFQRHYWSTIFVTWAIIFAIGGVSAWATLGAWPVVLSLLNTSIINTITHSRGKVRDLPGLGLLSLGETYHRAHHLEPSRQNYSGQGRIDLTGMILDLGDLLKHGFTILQEKLRTRVSTSPQAHSATTSTPTAIAQYVPTNQFSNFGNAHTHSRKEVIS